MGARDARVVDDEVHRTHAPQQHRQLEGLVAAPLLIPGQHHLAPKRIQLATGVQGINAALHGQYVGGLRLLPFDLVHRAGLCAPTNGDRPQDPEGNARRLVGRIQGRGIDPNLVRTTQVAQARRHVDGVTVAIPGDDFHLAAGYADAHRHAQMAGDALGTLAVLALQSHHRVHRLLPVRKQGQHAIAECFDNAPTMGDTALRDGRRDLGDGFCGLGISQCLKHRRAAVQVRENNSRLDTHAKNIPNQIEDCSLGHWPHCAPHPAETKPTYTCPQSSSASRCSTSKSTLAPTGNSTLVAT